MLGLGLPLLLIAALTNRTGFFTQPTVAYTRADDPAAPPAAVVQPVGPEVGAPR